jgi:transporter family-2 protein
MNLQTAIYLVAAVVVGGLGGIHVPINGALGVRIHSALVATLTFYGIAFLVTSAACLVVWDRPAFLALKTVPPWYFIAGVISVVVVGGSTFLIPRIGAVNVFVLAIAAQMLVRMVISHFGWFESPVFPITWMKVFGGLLLVIGSLLVVRH